MFPCVMEKPAFPTRDAPIGKRKLFQQSGRAVSRCGHESLQEKQVPTDRKSNFQILIICENKLSEVELYKSKFVTKITECNYLFTFQKSPYFFLNFFVIPAHFHYFKLYFKFYFPIPDIMVNHIYILFLRSRKTYAKCYDEKRKKSVARNIVASKKYRFLIFVRLDLVVLENCVRM